MIPHHVSIGRGIERRGLHLPKETRRTKRIRINPPGPFTGYLPKETFPEADLVRRSAVMMAPMLLGGDGHWGATDGAKFTAYAKWLVGTGVVTDAKNNTVKGDLPGGALFTNELFEGK